MKGERACSVITTGRGPPFLPGGRGADPGSLRIVVLMATVCGASLASVGWGDRVAADGSAIAQSLGGVASLLTPLTSTVGPGGAYGQLPNAAAVPFLGAIPTQGLEDVFAGLAGLGGFGSFTPGNDAAVSVITERIRSVDMALGGTNQDQLSNIDIACGECTSIGDVTSIRFRVTVQGDKTGAVPFTSLGLPSIGFLPRGGTLDVGLGWTVDVGIVADAQGCGWSQRLGTPTSSC